MENILLISGLACDRRTATAARQPWPRLGLDASGASEFYKTTESTIRSTELSMGLRSFSYSKE